MNMDMHACASRMLAQSEHPCMQAVESGEVALNMDTAHLRAYNPRLYLWLVRYPMEVSQHTRILHIAHVNGCTTLGRQLAQKKFYQMAWCMHVTQAQTPM